MFKIIHPKQTIPASKHLAFIFCLTPHCPNYSSNLILPKNLAKLCTEIQCNAELYIIKIAEDNLTKQNPNKNKKGLNAKHRFTPRENPSTLPIHKMTPQIHKTPNQYMKCTLPTGPNPKNIHKTIPLFLNNQKSSTH